MNKKLREQIKKFFMEDYKRVLIEEGEDLTIKFLDLKSYRNFKLVVEHNLIFSNVRFLLYYHKYNLAYSFIIDEIIIETEDICHIKEMTKSCIYKLNDFCNMHEIEKGYKNLF